MDAVVLVYIIIKSINHGAAVQDKYTHTDQNFGSSKKEMQFLNSL